MTIESATGPPSSPSSTSQSKISPTRAARIGQRECLAAYGHCMSGSPSPTTGHYWPRPSHIRRVGLPLHPCDVLFQRPPHSVRWIRAYGPVFPVTCERKKYDEQWRGVAALEKALADALKAAGYCVLNKVDSKQVYDPELWHKVKEAFGCHFAKLTGKQG